MEKPKHASGGLKITQFVCRDRRCSPAQEAAAGIVFVVLFDHQASGYWSERLQKTGDPKGKKAIGLSTQVLGDWGGSALGVGIV